MIGSLTSTVWFSKFNYFKLKMATFPFNSVVRTFILTEGLRSSTFLSGTVRASESGRHKVDLSQICAYSLHLLASRYMQTVFKVQGHQKLQRPLKWITTHAILSLNLCWLPDHLLYFRISLLPCFQFMNIYKKLATHKGQSANDKMFTKDKRNATKEA